MCIIKDQRRPPKYSRWEENHSRRVSLVNNKIEVASGNKQTWKTMYNIEYICILTQWVVMQWDARFVMDWNLINVTKTTTYCIHNLPFKMLLSLPRTSVSSSSCWIIISAHPYHSNLTHSIGILVLLLAIMLSTLNIHVIFSYLFLPLLISLATLLDAIISDNSVCCLVFIV